MISKSVRSAKRTDDEGRAYAGSQLQLQLYVHRRRSEIDGAICDALALDPAPLDWRSPVADTSYREYSDAAFLRALGLEHLEPALKQFWPSSGPRWDGLAFGRLKDRVVLVLVEAKNYPREVRGRGCQAVEGSESRKKIVASLRSTGASLGISDTSHWTGSLYQYANRLAHASFLAEHGVPTCIANVCFYDDPHKGRRTSLAAWEKAAGDLKREVGIEGAPPWLADVFLKARDRSELVPPAI